MTGWKKIKAGYYQSNSGRFDAFRSWSSVLLCLCWQLRDNQATNPDKRDWYEDSLKGCDILAKSILEMEEEQK